MTSTDLEPVSGEIERISPLLPMDVADAQRAMDRYQELCAAVLTPGDWIGAPGEHGSFVKKSGFDKLSTFYGVSVELLGDTILERDEGGKLLRASARARAIDLRTGRHRDGGGACGRNEPRFASSSGRQKIEHDLPATAETRATNRAIAALIGFGQVSAEEVDADVRAGAGSPTPPAWAADIPDDALERLEANLDAIIAAGGVSIADRPAAVVSIGNAITFYCDGVFPAACARLARLLVQAIPAEATPEGRAADAIAESFEADASPDDSQTVPAAAAPEPDSDGSEPVPEPTPATAAAPTEPDADDELASSTSAEDQPA